jgi:uncharacterized protein YdeI (YjbR/CyaY-like superfamily)
MRSKWRCATDALTGKRGRKLAAEISSPFEQEHLVEDHREKALALIASGEMKAAGLDAIANAKKNGRWDAAYDSPSAATVPGDFQAALDANPRARAFFETLDRAHRYAVLWRIQTVKKAETRARKIEQFIGMLQRKEKIHP